VSAVLDHANEIHKNVLRPAMNEWIEALTAMRAANDPDGPAIAGIVVLERLAKGSKELADILRDKVRVSCDDSGVLGFEAGAYEVARVRPKPQGEVSDADALRIAAPELFEPQPDKINRTELTKRLRKGEALPGAALGDAPIGHIQIRAKGR